MRYNLDKSSHSVYSLYYHLVVVTKYRRKVISPVVAESLKDIVYNISKKFDVEVVSQETDLDHIHILFKAKPTLEIPKFINSLKGVSSRLLLKKYPEIKKKLWGTPHLWSLSYCLITTGQVSLDVLKWYVESQGGTENAPDTED